MGFPTSLFDALLEPCFVLNKDLKIVYCNETAAVIGGMSVRKLMRKTLPEIFQFSEPVDWLQKIENVTDATPYKEIRYQTSEGGSGKVQITCQKLPDDEPQWIVFIRDVTLEERLQEKYRGELEQKEGYILELQQAKVELEKYSKNLEKMVEERTSEIRQLNRLMSALLDSLEQGFFVFGKDGVCHDFSSRACERILGGRPNKREAWSVLGLAEKQADGFKKWLTTIFAEMLPFEDLAPLGPSRLAHPEGLKIKLEYFPLSGESGIEGVVVVASDITSLVQAQEDAERERHHVQLILDLIQKRQQVSRFARETQGLLTELQEQLRTTSRTWDLDEIFRGLHTIKGGCSTLHLAGATAFAHDAESILSQYRQAPAVSLESTLLEIVQNIQFEFDRFLVEAKEILGSNAFSPERFVEVSVRELQDICQKLELSPTAKELVLGLKRSYLLEPIVSFFEPYNDVIQQVAQKENKQVAPLVFEGGDLAVSAEVYSALFGTFAHSFRNAVDHGIESPSLRQSKGKEATGTISVRFQKNGTSLKIEVTDDGGGIDPVRIRAKLSQNGINVDHEPDEVVIQHVFDASFSTRDQITETSGRGVGMDAIRAAAEDLGGTCSVTSRLGFGSTLTVEVPWLEAPAAGAGKLKAA